MKLKPQKSYDKRTQDSMKTWIQLIRTFQKVRAYELEHIIKHNLTMNQFEILEVLYHRGNLSVSEVTRLISSTPGNVTVVVKNLQKNALIEVVPSPKDGRGRILSITSEGEHRISAMFDAHAARLKSCFETLENDELDALFVSLRKIYKTNLKDL